MWYINLHVRVMWTRHILVCQRATWWLGPENICQLNSNSAKSAISQHISSCQTCQNSNLDVSSFKVIRNCHNEYETKIQEALLIKKLTPRLNSQLYANGCSFLLNVFWTFFHACVCVWLSTLYQIQYCYFTVLLYFLFIFFWLDFTMEKV